MFEDPLSHLRVLNDRHDSRHATASSAGENIDGECSPQKFSPPQSPISSGTVRVDQILLKRIESSRSHGSRFRSGRHNREPHSRRSRVVAISLLGSGEGPGATQRPGLLDTIREASVSLLHAHLVGRSAYAQHIVAAGFSDVAVASSAGAGAVVALRHAGLHATAIVRVGLTITTADRRQNVIARDHSGNCPTNASFICDATVKQVAKHSTWTR